MQKTAHYRMCVFAEENTDKHLQEILAEGFSQIDSDIKGTIFLDYFDELKCLVRKSDVGKLGMLYHFITFEQESKAAVIALADEIEKSNISEIPPTNENEEFIRAQLFLYVLNDDVLYITHNNALRDGGINTLLLTLANTNLNAEHQHKFLLMKAGNKKQLKAIFDKGIEYIELGLGTFDEAIDDLKEDGKLEEGVFKSLFTKDKTADEEEAMADVKVGLVLKPSRRWKKPSVKEMLSTIALDIKADHDGDFTIQTKAGPKITHKQLQVKRTVEVNGTNRILDTTQVGTQLALALKSLKDEEIVG